MKTRPLINAIGLLAAAGVAAGCSSGGGDTPSSSATPSKTSVSASPPASASSASSSSSSTPRPTYSVPPEAREHTQAGATAFVKFYFDQMNKAWMTPSAKLLPSLYDTTCGTCRDNQKEAEDLVESGDRYASRPVSLGAITVAIAAPDRVIFQLRVHQQKSDIVSATGEVSSTIQAAELLIDTATIWKDGKWLLVAQANAR